jgi:hypothetical protein
MKWQKERDDLIAQTKAFVQSVTGRTPQAVLSPIFSKAAPIENPFVAPVPAPLPPPLPIEPVVAAKSTETRPTEIKSREARPTEAKPADAAPIETKPIEQDSPSVKASTPGDLRKEIQTRVAAFQAHQHRFHRERDAYFNSVLTKARSAIEDGPDTPPA